MKKFKALAFIALTLIIIGCGSSGPKKALDEIAAALQENDPSSFLARIDLDAYANNSLTAMTSSNAVYDSLNSLSGMLGLGNLDQMINSVIDYKAIIKKELAQGVASGELKLQCAQGSQINCPWTPQALRDAQIIELNTNAAIAKVTTQAQLTSWLALRKNGENWQVVGQTLYEADARKLALAQPVPAKEPEPQAKSI